MYAFPPRQTELAHTADIHRMYRRLALRHEGAITPDVHNELWAQTKTFVPSLKETSMVDTPEVKSEPKPRFEALKDDSGRTIWRYIEAAQVVIRRSGYPQLRFRLTDSFTFKENENLWISGFTEDAKALALRGVDTSKWTAAGEYPVAPPVLVMVGYENMGKPDFRFRIREYEEIENGELPQPDSAKLDALVEAHEPSTEPYRIPAEVKMVRHSVSVDPDSFIFYTSNEWNSVDFTEIIANHARHARKYAAIGVELAASWFKDLDESNEYQKIWRREAQAEQSEDEIAAAAYEMIVDLAMPGDPMKPHTMTEDMQTEAERIASQLNRDLMHKAAELGHALQEIAALNQIIAELRQQLDTLAANQTLTPPTRNGAIEVCYFCETINTTGNQTDAAHKLGALRSEGWSIIYEQFVIDNGWTKHHAARLERHTRAVEPKPTTVPDGELVPNVTAFPKAEADDKVSASKRSDLACGGGQQRVGKVANG